LHLLYTMSRLKNEEYTLPIICLKCYQSYYIYRNNETWTRFNFFCEDCIPINNKSDYKIPARKPNDDRCFYMHVMQAAEFVREERINMLR
jgi:hypothetical protein